MSSNHEHNRPEIQERDTRLFLGLLESRVMTREQLAELYFSGSYEVAKKRLAKLTKSGFVVERKPKANPGYFFASILSLGRQGFETLRLAQRLPSFSKIPMTYEDVVDRVALARSTINHEIELIDHKVALSRALDKHASSSLIQFLTWPAHFQFETGNGEFGKRPPLLKPDAFIVIREEDVGEHSFFLEYDRATEVTSQLARKASGYHYFYTSGGFAERGGLAREDYRQQPFRVLYVLPSQERRNSIAERLLQVGRLGVPQDGQPTLMKNQHWLTTSAAFLDDPLGPIWLTLGEYWRATEGTVYDPCDHVTKVRVSARDRLITERVHLVPLMPPSEVSHG